MLCSGDVGEVGERGRLCGVDGIACGELGVDGEDGEVGERGRLCGVDGISGDPGTEEAEEAAAWGGGDPAWSPLGSDIFGAEFECVDIGRVQARIVVLCTVKKMESGR